MLWNLVANSLINLLTDHHICCLGYADGIVITIKGTHINTCFETAQYALSKIYEWYHEKGLSVNPNKAKALLLPHKRKYQTIGLSIFDKPIQLKKYVKYLGVYIDQTGRWEQMGLGPSINFADPSVHNPSNLSAQSFSVVRSYQQHQSCYQNDQN